MGRKLLEIRNFDKGMAGYIDGEDPDPEVGALALNVDPDAPMGVLRGIQGTASVLTHVGAATQFDRMRLLEKRSGENVIVGIEEATGEVGLIEDYDGTPTYNDLGQATVGNGTVISLVNNQAYIGVGSGPNDVPQWIGEVTNDQFGLSVGSGYQRENAVTRSPQILTFESTTNLKPAGTLATSLTVTSGDPLACPEKGVLIIPIRTFNPNTSEYQNVYAHVEYSSRTATTFDGLSYDTNAGTRMVNDYTLGAETGHELIVYSEVGVSFTGSAGTGGDLDKHWDSGAGDNFEDGRYYVLAASFTYEDYKESPLQILKRGGKLWGYEAPSGYTAEAFTPNIEVQGFFSASYTLPKRVTRVNIYLGLYDSIDASAQPAGLFRLVNTYDITEANATGETIGGDQATAVYTLETTYEGSTYEDVSGQPYNLESSTLHYSMAVELNSELFVADIYNPNAPSENWNNYICRSEPFRFENFDWINNYVVLPRPIVAIAEFAGRIYAFDRFTMYRINPQRLYIEDTYEGVGALNADSVITTEYGLFISSYHDVYRFDGREIRRISEPIANMEAVDGFDEYGYRQFVQNELSTRDSSQLRLGFDSELRCLIVYGNSATNTILWLYRIDRGTWFVADGTELPSFCASDRNSVLASGVADKTIYELFRGTRLSWTWISKKLAMGRTTQKKKFRSVEANGDAVSISYRIDNPAAAFAAISNLDSFQTSSNGQWLQLRVDGGLGEQCNSLGVLFRDKGGYPS